MVPAASEGIPPVPPYSGYSRPNAYCRYGTLTPYGRLSQSVPVRRCWFSRKSYYPDVAVTTAVWAVSRSLATTHEITIVFSSCGYLDVSVLRVCPHCWVSHLQCDGLPHSDTLGSLRASRSPKHFAACRVLHRHQKPRHPPGALCLRITVHSCYCLLFYFPNRSKNFRTRIVRSGE